MKKDLKVVLLRTLFFCFAVVYSFGQDQRVADSLAIIYEQDILRDTMQLELLRDLAFNEGRDPEKGLRYAEELIQLVEEQYKYRLPYGISFKTR